MLQKAKSFLFKQAQLNGFPEEMSLLRCGKSIPKSSKLKSLDLYLDPNGLLQIRSRIQNLNDNRDAIVLPTENYITFLLVRSFHERFHHTSHEAVINTIKGTFYIPKLRVLYKKVRKNCQICLNASAAPRPPLMAALPRARLAAFERPFTYVGIDFFGPLYVSVARRREKRWGVIFTCLTVRAIHIEVAYSLDTSSCVICINNFMSRRGTPREIYTDNGTNFKSASKIFTAPRKEIKINELTSINENIKWIFNPPSAPHMGGAWERLVRSIKVVLNSICPRMHFNDETLKGALCEVELIINARPLTFVSLDSNDDEALTPNHLLLGSTTGYKYISSDEADLRQRWYQTIRFADEFWKRWLREYTPVISRRTKWFEKQSPIKVGDVVIVVDEESPRNNWPKGVVLEAIQAKDGQIRSVIVKTSHGTLHRPATKVAVLSVGNKFGNQPDPQVNYGGGNVTAR